MSTRNQIRVKKRAEGYREQGVKATDLSNLFPLYLFKSFLHNQAEDYVTLVPWKAF